jgi:hypothetical protein
MVHTTWVKKGERVDPGRVVDEGEASMKRNKMYHTESDVSLDVSRPNANAGPGDTVTVTGLNCALASAHVPRVSLRLSITSIKTGEGALYLEFFLRIKRRPPIWPEVSRDCEEVEVARNRWHSRGG